MNWIFVDDSHAVNGRHVVQMRVLRKSIEDNSPWELVLDLVNGETIKYIFPTHTSCAMAQKEMKRLIDGLNRR